MATCLVISKRIDDIELGVNLARNAHMKFHAAPSISDIKKLDLDFAKTLVLWDIDHAQANQPSHEQSIHKMGQFLFPLVPSRRIITLSDQPTLKNPQLSKAVSFGHFLNRKYESECLQELLPRIAIATLTKSPFGIKRYIPTHTSSSSIILRSSQQRQAAVRAVENIFTKKKVPSRLVSLVAQAVDETLMNAIFDAPVDRDNHHYRRNDDRSASFQFSRRELIKLDMATTPHSIVIGVTDQFGSVDRKKILRLLLKNRSGKEYRQANTADKGAGLGIFGMLHSGLSLLFITAPGIRTQVFFFFPIVKNFKAFRKSFQYAGFLTP